MEAEDGLQAFIVAAGDEVVKSIDAAAVNVPNATVLGSDKIITAPLDARMRTVVAGAMERVFHCLYASRFWAKPVELEQVARCRGSWFLGSACGRCAHCGEEALRLMPGLVADHALLDEVKKLARPDKVSDGLKLALLAEIRAITTGGKS